MGCRLTTFELTYPRFIHAEIMTHRMFSRNAASSRAIPIKKMLQRVEMDPAIPIDWGKNQAGMQAGEPISKSDQMKAINRWLAARDSALKHAQELKKLGIHKQIVNRIVEPFMWITVILSTTSFKHFRLLRDNSMAEPHFRLLARQMVEARNESCPVVLGVGEWHLPLIREEDRDLDVDTQIKISAARCARVSYLTHDGKRDVEKDIELHERLVGPGHWSPFEHVARAEGDKEWRGNFQGFTQYRKTFKNEFVSD